MIRIILIIISLYFTMSSFWVESASLKVSPAQLIIHNVSPGHLYNIYKATNIRLTIYNDESYDQTWKLRIKKPQDKSDTWEKGYNKIPDTSWCYFESNEITVKAKSKGFAHMFVNIPDEEKFYNQHWVAIICVDGAVGSGISLAVDVRVLIETVSKASINNRPYGLLGIAPSMLTFDIRVGETVVSDVTLYNNDANSHTYSIHSLFDESYEDLSNNRNRYLSYSYLPIPETDWIKYPKQFRIEKNQIAKKEISISIPGHVEQPNSKFEDILLIQSDQATLGFIRIRINNLNRGE